MGGKGKKTNKLASRRNVTSSLKLLVFSVQYSFVMRFKNAFFVYA